MNLLQDVISDINVHSNNALCEICSLVKHHRPSFSLSLVKYSQPFDIVHCIIWGPFAGASHTNHHYFFFQQ